MATNAEMRQPEAQQEEVSEERPKTQTTQTDELPPNLNVPNWRASSQDTAIGDIEKGDAQRDGQQQDGHQPDEPPKRSKGKIAVIMFALMMAVFLAALDVTIITTALPTISEHFHSSAGYTWIGSAFLLANSASIPSWGKVSDIFGRKPMLLLANVIFLIGSLVAGLSNSIGMLIAARAIQGIGGGGLVILVNITIGDLFSLRSRGAFYGLIGAVWAIASAIGPVIGGAFTEKVTWRWCFYVNLPLDGCALLILFFFLDLKTPRTNFLEGLKAIDWVGSLLVVGGTLMLLFGLQYGGVTYPWDSATVICLLVFGAVTFGLFFFWEYKYAKFPVMPMQLFDKVTNIGTLGVVFFHGFVFIAGSYYLPLYFQAILGATPILSGVYLLPTALSLAFTSIGTGVFIRKTGMFLPPMYFGMIMMVAGYGAFIDLSAHSGWGKIIGFQIIAGLGIGPIFQSPIIALQAHINPRDIGTATATLGFVRQLATATSVVIGQVVFQNHMKKYSAQLTRVLGPQLAEQLGGGSAGANVDIIDGLPANEKSIVREDFAKSLSTMWIMYCAFAAAGVFCVLFVRKKVLTRQHEETKTGLEAEKANAAERAAERESKRESKRQSRIAKSESKASFVTSGTDSRPHSRWGTSGSRPQSGVSGQSSGIYDNAAPPVPTLSNDRVNELNAAESQQRRKEHQVQTLSRLESGVAS